MGYQPALQNAIKRRRISVIVRKLRKKGTYVEYALLHFGVYSKKNVLHAIIIPAQNVECGIYRNSLIIPIKGFFLFVL
jgi:hypothetical protein